MKGGGKTVLEGLNSKAVRALYHEVTHLSAKPAKGSDGTKGFDGTKLTGADKTRIAKLLGSKASKGVVGYFAHRMSVGAKPPKGTTPRGLVLAKVALENPAVLARAMINSMAKLSKWTREEIVRVFEILIEQGAHITSHPKFRGLLDRDQNLYANQVTREANGNIAYRSVDFELDGLDEKEFWNRIDSSPHKPLIEDNAAATIYKMAEKFGIIS